MENTIGNNRLKYLDKAINIFNTISVICVIITALSSILVMIFNNEATKIRDMKDEKTAISLKDADVKIATLNNNSLVANQKLEETKLKLLIAEKETAEIRNKTAEIENKNLNLERSLIEEKTKVMEMESDLAPRKIEQYESRKILIKYKNYNVTIRCALDQEANKFAGMLNLLFHDSQWNVKVEKPTELKIVSEGLTIESYEYPLGDRDTTIYKNDETWEFFKKAHEHNVTDDLYEIFKKNNVEASFLRSDLPQKQITITVGPKPNKFRRKDFHDPNRRIIIEGNTYE